MGAPRARIGRALFHRARSASTQDSLPLHPLPSFCLFLPLSLSWPVYLFGQVAGLGQTARVQRGPSEAARCASNGTALLPALRGRSFFTFFPSRPVSYFRARAGRISVRDQSAVGSPLLLSRNGCRRQWRRMFEATPSRSVGVASFRRQVEAKPRAVNGALWLQAERASQLWPALLHRPLLFLPRHLPKHPLIA